MKRIRKQILAYSSFQCCYYFTANASFTVANNAAIEAKIIEELDRISDTIYLTDPTEHTEDPDLQESTEHNDTTEFQDLNKSPEITIDEELETYKKWKQGLRITPSYTSVRREYYIPVCCSYL